MKNSRQAKSVIVAAGARPRRLRQRQNHSNPAGTGLGFFCALMSTIENPSKCTDRHLRQRVEKFVGNNTLRVQAFVIRLGRLSDLELQAICKLPMCNKRRAAEILLKFRASKPITQDKPSVSQPPRPPKGPSGQPANSSQHHSVKSCVSPRQLPSTRAEHESAQKTQQSGHKPCLASLIACGDRQKTPISSQGNPSRSPRAIPNADRADPKEPSTRNRTRHTGEWHPHPKERTPCAAASS